MTDWIRREPELAAVVFIVLVYGLGLLVALAITVMS
jgi:hypothetical protein